MSIEKVNYLEIGKNIIESNPFYNTLNLFLKYYFVNNREKDYYLNTFIKDIIKNEDEFKVFIVFKEYSLQVYYDKFNELFKNLNSTDDIIHTLLGYVKINYEIDKNVIKPFILSITDNKTEIINKFNFIKTTYIFKIETMDKFKKLKDSITYLEKAKYHEEQAKHYNNMAIDNLKDIKFHFENTFEKINYEDTTNILGIKN
jgi:hypothetical protein